MAKKRNATKFVPVRAAPAAAQNTRVDIQPADADWKEIQRIYDDLKANGNRYKPLWDRISQLVGIGVNPDYLWNSESDKDLQLDEYVDDPTAAISVNQAGDYLLGILWGTGEGVVDLVPSRYVTEQVDAQLVQPWYDFATSQVLYHLNHEQCGYSTALRPYAYDQFSFGTSGVGLFKNQAFLNRTEENCITARNYGIDNTRIKDGKSGAPDIGSVVYHWGVAQIVGEFCTKAGNIIDADFAKLPQAVQKCYSDGNYNQMFDLVFMWMPRHDFDPKLRGKRGARYRGVWFFDKENNGKIFCEDSYPERPINMTRMIRVRGEDYGRSSGTMLLSSISSVNFIFAITCDILEKMANPALGTYGNAIFGDAVLDTSPNGLTIFNQALADGKAPPIFPIHDTGDPSGIIKFLMPFMEEKITTGFKIDALLDFNSAKDMTATESLQRYNIRGKSLSGMLGQQKIERLIPDMRRAISICYECGELGVNPKTDPKRAARLNSLNKTERVIPEAVLSCIAEGRPWFELRFNNELEKLLRTEHIQALTQIIQAITAIAALYPQIIEAIKWYDLLKAINDNLDSNSQILVTAKEFKDIIAKAAAQKQVAMQAQLAQAAGQVGKDTASANQANAQAGAIRNGQVQNATPPIG